MPSRFTFCVQPLYLLRFARVDRAQVGFTLLSRCLHNEIAVYAGVSVVRTVSHAGVAVLLVAGAGEGSVKAK